ncbi:hypothetical protein GJR96_16890 [Haloferax sp. MBLA0076]|uniref:Uncharacterized protein n=1 Tax=Haloferax litoreum TaxID=2666140 RepID=A0A6A8GKA8_9EURY|nr:MULTISPECIES: hypothetical protein [Haloferax]KAB1189861.1 hypothetical protein Hfx1148_16835 [Haloferax sp. CBA1148]MRX23623.1 hypothetical protein [Haloferax litoreum]
MNRKVVGIALGAIVVLTVVIGGGLFVVDAALTSYFHSYTYRVAVETDTDLTDVTIYVPVPTRDGETLTDVYADAAVVQDPAEWIGDDGSNVPDATGGSADWTTQIVETAHGPMLSLRASSVEAGTYVFGANTMLEQGRIHTADPWASDFVLTPANDVTQDECPSWADETERCYTYRSHLYADADAPTRGTVSVSVSLHGQTDWGFVFANGWNWFNQRTSATFDETTNGWVDTEGTLKGGAGTYP